MSGMRRQAPDDRILHVFGTRSKFQISSRSGGRMWSRRVRFWFLWNRNVRNELGAAYAVTVLMALGDDTNGFAGFANGVHKTVE